jgi:two-component system, cell cycle response regulator
MPDTHWVPTICQPLIDAGNEVTVGDEVCLLQIHPVEIDSSLNSIDHSPFSVGRDNSCDLTLSDASVSRRHALLERVGTAWQISDCGSTNGVLVNDVAVSSALLEPGDRIRIGSRVLKFLSRTDIETEYHATVYSMMTRDTLTGAFNKQYFSEVLDRELHRSVRHQRPVSLLLFDIDHFKSINDTHGHLAGDDVLREIGKRVSHCLRDDDILARYGGEEFAVILAETPQDKAAECADRCRRAVADFPFTTCDGPLTVTISVGVAEAGSVPTGSEQLIQRADQQLYRAKHDGRNRVCSPT